MPKREKIPGAINVLKREVKKKKWGKWAVDAFLRKYALEHRVPPAIFKGYKFSRAWLLLSSHRWVDLMKMKPQDVIALNKAVANIRIDKKTFWKLWFESEPFAKLDLKKPKSVAESIKQMIRD